MSADGVTAGTSPPPTSGCPAELEVPAVKSIAPVSGAAVSERHSGLGDDAAVTVEQARRRYWRQRAWSSRVLHRLGQLTSHAGAGLLAGVVVIGWLIVGLAIDFPGWWEDVLYIASSLTTLIMVFAVQHTQARQAAATQRK